MRARHAWAALAAGLGIAACIADVVPTEPAPSGSTTSSGSASASASSGAGGASTSSATASESASSSASSTGTATSSASTSSTSSGAGGACPQPVAACGDAAWTHWKPLDKHVYTLTGSIVVDQTTKLSWTYDVSAQIDHDAAIAYCQALQTGGCNDWRLPTRTEIASLVDYASTAQKLLWDPIFDPGPMTAPATQYFWTATASLDPMFPGDFWYVHFQNGLVATASKGNPFYVRCVR
jgi:Protein of unknown function (DUF1566)